MKYPLAMMSNEKKAAKYCFKASCKLVNMTTKQPMGAFVTYGKSPEITRDVFIACNISLEGFPEGCVCDDDIDLTLLEECPVECVREVKYIPQNEL
jgi:hypothetical protein